MSLGTEILSLLGLALADDHRAAEARVAELYHSLKSSKQSIADLTQQLEQARCALLVSETKHTKLRDAVKQMLAQHDWCSPHLIEFPADTPNVFHKRTVSCLQTFLGPRASVSDLTNADEFSSKEQWILYWCLAHACRAAAITAAAKTEDGISRAFLDALKDEAKASSNFIEAGRLQIAYNAIFEQSEPAMKEAAVGADILLIIAGESLVPNGLARIFWIQAKKAAAGAYPLTLRYDQKNSQGLQVNALSKVDVPERGSFGLYMQYSNRLSYIPAAHVGDLAWTDGRFVGDLSAIGVRLPELLVACTCNSTGVGAFANTDDLRAYLDEVSDMKPLFIVTAAAGGREYRHELAKNHLLSQISDYYREKLGLARTYSLERDLEYEMGR